MGKVWATLFVACGLLVALGLVPGSASWAAAPRAGIATVLLVLGGTLWAIALVPLFLRRTTKAADYKGGCPVGATCACGHFNFKPRATCKQCGQATTYAG